MAKKQIEYIIEPLDGVEIMRLAKVAIATHNDCESIFHLYKKYINAALQGYKTDCNCSNSISNLWQSLMNYYSENNGKTK
jgi:hypothetical protein